MRVFPLSARLYIATVLVVTSGLSAALAFRMFGGGAALVIGAAVGAILYSAFHVASRLLVRGETHRIHGQQLSDLHLATVEALALAIEARDESAARNRRRGPDYAAAMAEALGLSTTDVQGVRAAALLRDVGKLAVPEQLLSKSGPLTQEEFHKIRTHPQVGADIIGGVPFPYPVASVIRSHHERWDGDGYPAGLAGEDIPLGARILAVIDYFEALISERPHHRPLSADAALTALSQASGKALDPTMVRTFVELYPSLAAAAACEPSVAARLGADASVPATDLAANRASVFHDIALAHREIYGLYEIAQAVGGSLGVTDTMALISSKLSSLVPFSCCALFLRSDREGVLRCAYATGVEAQTIEGISMRDGQGLNGWVARTRRPVLNGRPRADLDAAGCADSPSVLESALVCPLIFDGRCLGTLAVYHTQTNMYTDDHRRLLERISEQTAAVIHHSLLFEQTQEDSLTDPLTGLPNSRFMVMHLERELARADRLQSEVSLMVMDLDRFKEINDTYGHHVGDRALRAVGGALRGAMRQYDICVRYAGDEFVAVLAGCGPEEAERKRVEVQRAVAALRFEPRPGEIRSLTVSAGAAVFPHDGIDQEVLLATADSRMYRDKTRWKPAQPSSGSLQASANPGAEREFNHVKDGTTGR